MYCSGENLRLLYTTEKVVGLEGIFPLQKFMAYPQKIP